MKKSDYFQQGGLNGESFSTHFYIFPYLLHLLYPRRHCILSRACFRPYALCIPIHYYRSIGSVFFSILRFGNARDAFAGLFALFIIQFLITRTSSAMFILRDIGFIVAVGTSIYLFFVSYFKKGKGGGILAPVIIGALLGACNLIVTFLLLLVGRHSLVDNFPALVLNAVIGILIGLGIGIGILISDKVVGPKSA